MIRLRVPAAVCAAALSVLVVPPAVAKPPPPPPPSASAAAASQLRLTGICPWSEGASKEVSAVLRGPLLAPYSILDAKGKTVAVLKPYQVTASGEGLKSRHLLPGVYTRRGPAPRAPITCDFGGATADGPVSLTVVGTVAAARRCGR